MSNFYSSTVFTTKWFYCSDINISKKEEEIYVESAAKKMVVVVPRECTSLTNVESASKLVARVDMLLDVVLQIFHVSLFAKIHNTHNIKHII
jgi:hypothetical protein